MLPLETHDVDSSTLNDEMEFNLEIMNNSKQNLNQSKYCLKWLSFSHSLNKNKTFSQFKHAASN